MEKLGRNFIIAVGLVALFGVLSGCASAPHAQDDAAHKPCTIDRAHYAGLMGWTYADVCSLDKPELKFAYERGLERSAAQSALSRDSAEREAERKRVDEDQSVVNHVSKFFNVVGTGSTTPSEDERVRRAEDRLEKSTDGVALSPDFRTPTQNTVSYFGPAMSAMVGFGTGHVVQDRWLRDGWIWTAVDVGLIAGIGVAAHNCESGEPCANLPGAFVLGLLGSRVWQTVDTAREARRRQVVRVAPLAASASGVAPGVTLAVGF